MQVELQILDPRLPGWGFPSRGSALSAGVDLHACIDAPLVIEPQAAPMQISAGFALRIGDPGWCGLVVPRSGLAHLEGLVLGNTIGLIDADYEGPCLISVWNRNPAQSGEIIMVSPGDRIAQLVLVRTAQPEFVVVASFSAGRPGTSRQSGVRGAGGFGSTGVKAACPATTTGRNSSETP